MSGKIQEERWAMRADEVLRLLPIGKNTLYEWVSRNEIPHIRVGRVILFPREAMREWLKNRCEKGGGQ